MKSFGNTRVWSTKSYRPSYLLRRGLALVACGAVCAALTACGGPRPLPQVEPLTFTDGLGNAQTPPAELKAGLGTYLDVVIANDAEFLGVNWSVSCSNQPPVGTPLPPGQPVDNSCGTFSPAHTLSGPVPQFATSGAGYVTFYTAPAAVPKDGTVTLYASSTSDPSQYSTVTLTIASQ